MGRVTNHYDYIDIGSNNRTRAKIISPRFGQVRAIPGFHNLPPVEDPWRGLAHKRHITGSHVL